MTSLFRNTLVFVVGYVIFMIPTYLLPWLGSNSTVLNVVGAAIGHGMTPQWWAHAWCLSMLILMTWIRGDFIGKKYLPAFPFLAAVFDLTPGLSMIPLIPTALHLAAIILGVKVSEQQAISDDVTMSSSLASTSRKAGILAGLMTAAAIFGSILFVSTSKKKLIGVCRTEKCCAHKKFADKIRFAFACRRAGSGKSSFRAAPGVCSARKN